MSQQGPYFSPHSKVKANYKSTNLRTNGIYWYKLCWVYSEKTRLKKLMMMKMIIIIISIMNKSQEMTIFHGRQKLTSAMN